ncbi:MAG: DUF2961 domain-containing protein [Cyclobacteriaceae bacterium]|nr:DUF2961 domain-containing protein [Cyclobacteriaceae bacterium]
MKTKNLLLLATLLVITLLLGVFQSCSPDQSGSGGQLYDLGTGLVSRSISFENPTGEPGQGGQTSSNLGVGRKGFPAKGIAPGETVVLCDIAGAGTIRHIWMTGGFKNKTEALRSMVVRAYWENQEHPSVECPLGDFMGSAHAKANSYQSAVHSTGINAALNIWLPMPFNDNAKMTLTNEGDENVTLFYQIDYTIGDRHPERLGRLHVCFVRQNPTTLTEDFEILPKRTGEGRFIGTVLGIRTLEGNWWGEGEVKIFMDGDNEFPTICGTGSEDYVCVSYGMQQTPFQYHGCSWNHDGFISMYRWHLPDPIYWKEECRITIQQIGYSPKLREETGHPLYERQDDWSSATFWYEPVPSAQLPEFPDLESRVANLWEEKLN